MLLIHKKKTPSAISRAEEAIRSSSEWKSVSESNTNAIRKTGFDTLPKDIIRQNLLEEQRYLCAYCMKRIENNGSHTVIEHLAPLSKDKEKSLDYQNMAAVCKGGADVRIEEGEKRILCCDGSKHDEDELLLSPYNEQMMKEICYYSDGQIYFRGLGNWSEQDKEKIEREINSILCLNGKRKKDGSFQDTATQLLKGRRDAYEQAESIIRRLSKKGNLTSERLKKEMNIIRAAEKYPEYAGVILFVLECKYRRLKSQGR